MRTLTFVLLLAAAPGIGSSDPAPAPDLKPIPDAVAGIYTGQVSRAWKSRDCDFQVEKDVAMTIWVDGRVEINAHARRDGACDEGMAENSNIDTEADGTASMVGKAKIRIRARARATPVTNASAIYMDARKRDFNSVAFGDHVVGKRKITVQIDLDGQTQSLTLKRVDDAGRTRAEAAAYSRLPVYQCATSPSDGQCFGGSQIFCDEWARTESRKIGPQVSCFGTRDVFCLEATSRKGSSTECYPTLGICDRHRSNSADLVTSACRNNLGAVVSGTDDDLVAFKRMLDDERKAANEKAQAEADARRAVAEEELRKRRENERATMDAAIKAARQPPAQNRVSEITPAMLDRALAAISSDIRACGSSGAGTVAVRIMIVNEEAVVVEVTSTPSVKLGECIVRAVQKVKLPPANTGLVTIRKFTF